MTAACPARAGDVGKQWAFWCERAEETAIVPAAGRCRKSRLVITWLAWEKRTEAAEKNGGFGEWRCLGRANNTTREPHKKTHCQKRLGASEPVTHR